MSEFTLLETVVYHRMLWAEVTEDELNDKRSANFWHQQKITPHELVQSCFPCDLAKQLGSKSKPDCHRCIFAFKPDCFAWNSLYHSWLDSTTTKTRRKYAALIRDIPLKPKYAKELNGL